MVPPPRWSGDVLGALESRASGLVGTADVLARQSRRENLPPHHLEAISPEAAYPLAKLVPAEIACSPTAPSLLQSARGGDTAAASLAASGCPPYVVSLLPLLLASPDGSPVPKAEALVKSRWLAYLRDLLALQAIPVGKWLDADALIKAGVSSEGAERLLERFAERQASHSRWFGMAGPVGGGVGGRGRAISVAWRHGRT